MCWYKNEMLVNEILDYACVRLTENETQRVKEACMQCLAEETKLKERLIHVLRACPEDSNELMPDERKYVAERLFEQLFDRNLLDAETLTFVFVSLWTMRRPYQYFTSDKLRLIFRKLQKPVADAFSNINDLPEELTIYRGIRGFQLDRKNLGFSWTLNRDKAINFGTGTNQCDGFLLCATANRDDIIAYFNGREEEEIIILPENVREIMISLVYKHNE